MAALACAMLAACAGPTSDRIDPRYGVAASPRVIDPGQPVPRGGGVYRLGVPYTVGDRTYVPEDNRSYQAEGAASWYGSNFHGRRTANGEIYDMHALSAAHPTLPMPSYVRVTNLANRRSVIVRVNDRGPFHGGRIIDLSGKAAELLAFRHHGVARVRVEYVAPAPLEGSDDRVLLATLREGSPAPAPSLLRVASTRPIVPETSASRVWSGPVPLPQERPFDLGPGASAREAARQAQVFAARAPARRNGAEEAAGSQPALAPAGAPLSFVSGRGLY